MATRKKLPDHAEAVRQARDAAAVLVESAAKGLMRMAELTHADGTSFALIVIPGAVIPVFDAFMAGLSIPVASPERN